MNEQTLKKEQSIAEKMVTDILVVHLADSMEAHYAKIAEKSDRFVVILDDENVPLYVATSAKMKGLANIAWQSLKRIERRLPKALLVDENVTLERVMVFYKTMLDPDQDQEGRSSPKHPSPEGLVVMSDDQVVGVLPDSVLIAYFDQVVVPEWQAQGVPIQRTDDLPHTIANAVFRCRRYPKCPFEVTVELVDKPPQCGIQAAHGRARLKS